MHSQLKSGPGRSCPLDYRYGAAALAAPARLSADSLWVAGGLYGNPFALQSLEDLFAQERDSAALVFNGDFHWFDVDDRIFAQVEAGVMRHRATRGNVETEISAPRPGAGCGCGYPDWVDDGDVARSNRIVERLKATAARAPGAAARLADLPMFEVAEVGGLRVAIVHGDADSLAGWGFSQEELATRDGRDAAEAAFRAAGVQIFASSHTCLPVLQTLEGGVIVNNGAAGMPNFARTAYGLATRISPTPHPRALYCARVASLHVEAIPIAYDAQAWRKSFLAQWPAGSEAHASYWNRLVNGPRYGLELALRAA